MLRVLGAGALVVVTLAVAFFGWAFHQNKQGTVYVVEAVPAIYSTWNFPELRDRASRELRDNPDFEKRGPGMFGFLEETLGEFQSALEPQGRAGLGWGRQATAEGVHGQYVVRAEFEKGPADLYFLIVREDDAWKIAAFNVNSPLLSKVPPEL